MMCDHRSYTHNLSSCEIKARKKIIQAWTGFEPMTSAIPFFTFYGYITNSQFDQCFVDQMGVAS